MGWCIFRVLNRGEGDYDNVKVIQDAMKAYPLSAYGNAGYVAPKGTYDASKDGNPVQRCLAMSLEDYFAKANALMVENPPLSFDGAILKRLEKLGVGPGLKLKTIEQGEEMFKTVKASFKADAVAVAATNRKSIGGIWSYFKDPIGDFGDAYEFRAAVALVGLGANTNDVAIYPRTDNDYYGTLSHNIKAVYQKYMGWYDANPVNLDLLSPTETAKKLVEYMGDAQRVLNLARKDFAKGEYQWVAQVTKELVYADPSNMEARRLCADALEQLGYQSESGTWRNAYLTGAMELRAGTPAPAVASASNMFRQLTVGSLDMFFEFAAIFNNSNDLQDNDVVVNFVIDGEKCCVVRRNGLMLTYMGTNRSGADATATGSKQGLYSFFCGNYTGLNITGNSDAVISLTPQSLDISGNFGIIEP